MAFSQESRGGQVSGVIVTFNPDIAAFPEVMHRVAAQTEHIIVVDNGSQEGEAIGQLVRNAGGCFLSLGGNRGLATAQNRGIELARQQGADAILMMDQDSLLRPDAVLRLREALDRLRGSGVAVASLGCSYVDTHDGAHGAIWRARGLRVRREEIVAGAGVTEADFVIASGSLLPLKALDAVGPMDEPLFIDLVDLEWGFRATALGFRHFQCHAALMEHTLGAGRTRFAGRQITLHAPARNYFWLRNALILARRRYVAPAWRLYFLLRIAPYLGVYTLKGGAPGRRFHLMMAGLRDGLRGRGGGLPSNL